MNEIRSENEAPGWDNSSGAIYTHVEAEPTK